MGIEPTWDGIRPTSVLKTVSVTRALAASVICCAALPVQTQLCQDKICDFGRLIQVE